MQHPMVSDLCPAWRMSHFVLVDIGSLELADQEAASAEYVAWCSHLHQSLAL